MRKTRMLVAICFVLIVTPILMGARFLSLGVTANPGGVKGSIQGDGTYTLNKTDKFVRVNYTATNSVTKAMPSFNDATGGGKFKVTMTVPAGTYNPNDATLYYMDDKNVLQTLPVQDTTNYVVK